MKILEQNIMNAFGEKGAVWLANLPSMIAKLINFWKLDQITPVENMTFNYVAKAFTSANQPVVLKISYDQGSITQEVKALRHFDGNGSIQLIGQNAAYHAILLQQAMPGITLTSLYPSEMEYVMDCYIDTMKKLHIKTLINKPECDSISSWLNAIDHVTEFSFPLELRKKAIALKNQLLSSIDNHIFLHGDLHLDNIIKDECQWLAIDPKGVVGEPEFEIAAFNFMSISELVNKNDARKIIENRVELLAEKSNLNAQRIKNWVFVRLILMAAWQIEDGGDPSLAMKLAKICEPMTVL